MSVYSGPKGASIPGGEGGIVLRYLGGNCPVQSEGTIDGEPFYFRARGEEWSIEIGGGFVLEDAEKGIPDTGFYYEEEWGDEPYAAGWMPDDVAREMIDKAAAVFRKTRDANYHTAGNEGASLSKPK